MATPVYVQLPLFALDKRCARCRLFKDRSAFHADRASRDGLWRYCKDCTRIINGSGLALFIAPRLLGVKYCPGCRCYKVLARFHRSRTGQLGRADYCAACCQAIYERDKAQVSRQQAAYYRANRERILARLREHAVEHRERVREWRRKNLERKRAYARAYYAKHAEHLRALQRDHGWAKQHPEEHRQRGRAYRLAHKEANKVRAHLYYMANKERYQVHVRRRKMRQRSAEGTFTPRDIRVIYEAQEGHCAYCGVVLNGRFHIEHGVPLSRGGTNWPSNLACACALCNLRKWTKTDEEFMVLLAEEARAQAS